MSGGIVQLTFEHLFFPAPREGEREGGRGDGGSDGRETNSKIIKRDLAIN